MPGAPGHAWTGFRYGWTVTLRVACLLVALARIWTRTLTAELEAAALDVARAALLRDQAERTAQLDHLLATARRVAETLDLDTVLSAIVLDASTLLGADSGDMLLWDRER